MPLAICKLFQVLNIWQRIVINDSNKIIFEQDIKDMITKSKVKGVL
jgi:hypothetical protein